VGFAIVFLAFRNVYTILNAKGFQKNRLRGGLTMKKVNILIIVLLIGNMIFGGECMAMQETEKLSKPQIAPDKTFVQSKKVTYKNKGKLTI